MMANKENNLLLNKHFLLCIGNDTIETTYLKQNFCGNVTTNIDDVIKLNDVIIYVLGDMTNVSNITNTNTFVIKELSFNYDNNDKLQFVTLGSVPLNVNNVGLFFREFFNEKNYFELLNNEHQFQILTESNKPGMSYRKGIYLTKVEENGNDINFNLLRCSTNLDGPTDNFRNTDNEIVNKVNDISQHFFEQRANFNHVLAQVYNNTKIDGKEKKAKIKEHSDKTKDMPINGLMAFCTFYNFENVDLKEVKKNGYDYCYKGNSVLTKLRFRLKKTVVDTYFTKNFDVILYPGSVFMMSLSINRLYTHEIIPPYLSINKLPTRLGYVVRCSKTQAVFKDNQTYIKNSNSEFVKLEEPTDLKIKNLKDLYFKENVTTDIMDYGDINFSLNNGDYLKPIL